MRIGIKIHRNEGFIKIKTCDVILGCLEAKTEEGELGFDVHHGFRLFTVVKEALT